MSRHDDMVHSDFDNLVTARGFDRRDFVRAALGSGFAAAVLPVTAQTLVRTPTDGLVAGEVTVDVGGFAMPAYRAAPAGRTNLPVVLVMCGGRPIVSSGSSTA